MDVLPFVKETTTCEDVIRSSISGGIEVHVMGPGFEHGTLQESWIPQDLVDSSCPKFTICLGVCYLQRKCALLGLQLEF